MKHIKSFLNAIILGLATLILCVVLADAILNMNVSVVGKIVFCVSVIMLPIFAGRFVKWRYTVINLPLFYAMYFPLSSFYRGGIFSDSGGFITFPAEVYALATALILWSLESIVYAVRNIFVRITRKRS